MPQVVQQPFALVKATLLTLLLRQDSGHSKAAGVYTTHPSAV